MTDANGSTTAMAAENLRKLKIETDAAAVDLEKAKFDLANAKFAGLVPDFKDVQRGSLELKDNTALFADRLAALAMDEAAESLALRLTRILNHQNEWKLLVTDDPELADSDATYHHVVTAIGAVEKLANSILIQNGRDSVAGLRARSSYELERDSRGTMNLTGAVGIPLAVGTAVAKAVPPLLAAFASKRTIATTASKPGDLTAAMATVGHLPHTESQRTVHDSFRLIGESKLHGRVAEIGVTRATLAALLADVNDRDDEEESAEKTELTAAIGSIDSLVTYLVTPPKGESLSPLDVAAMHEQVQRSAESADRFTHVVLIQSGDSHVQQVIDDKPFFLRDRFASVASASIKWMLLDLSSNVLVDSGISHGAAHASGKIGSSFKVKISGGSE